jgi:CBS domain-containing protein
MSSLIPSVIGIEKEGDMRAKDLMIPLQDRLDPDITLEEAVNRLKTAKRGEKMVGVKGLPVLDKKGKLIGMLSMGDILKAVWPSYMSMMDLGEFTWDGMVEDFAKKVAERKVADLMTREVVTIEEESPLMECVDHMVRHNVKRLPVLDRHGKVIGMLYERDVFLAVTKSLHAQEGGGKK